MGFMNESLPNYYEAFKLLLLQASAHEYEMDAFFSNVPVFACCKRPTGL
jgi:hypothetical protein